MALPTGSDTQTLNFSLNGLPFCTVATKSSIDLLSLNTSLNALPGVGNNAGASSSTVTLVDTIAVSDTVTQQATISLEETLATSDSVLPAVLLTFSDTLATDDSILGFTGTISLGETVALSDSVFLQPILLDDGIGLGDSLSQIITLRLEELVGVADSGGNSGITLSLSDTLAVSDTASPSLLVNLSETVALSDTADPFILDVLEAGVTVQVSKYEIPMTGVTTQVNEWVSLAQSGVNVNVYANNLVATTNASSLSNVFTPTLIVNGNVIYSNPATLPASGVSNARCFVNISCNSIPGNSLSEVYNWSLNFDFFGGSWSVISKYALGALGDQITLFGFTGTITRLGRERSNSADGYRTSGIFGSPQLHKQLSLSIYGNPITGSSGSMMGSLPNQALYVPNIANWRTHREAAMFIAAAAGISLLWAANDTKLTDFFPQVGQTALYALQSLAQEVGAVLRWYGNNNYVITYPNRTFGNWTLPDCCLLGQGGLAFENVLDLETGLSGTGITSIPYMRQFNAGVKQIENPKQTGDSTPPIQQIYTIRTALQAGSPFVTIPIPDDYYKVYVQCLVGADGGTPDTSGADYVTTNSAIWTPISPTNIFTTIGVNPLNTTAANRQIQDAINETNINPTGMYIAETVQGTVRTKILIIEPTVFTSVLKNNTSVTGGLFALNFGITRLNLSGFLDATQKETDDQERQILFREQNRYRFFRLYDGSIATIFSGAIPLPGMEATATQGDLTVSGVIESVSFSFPGTVNISVGQYRRIDFYGAPLSTLTSLSPP